MEFTKEEDNHAKILLPELISRSKRLRSLTNQRKHKSPCVAKVYNSKKKQIIKLKEQIQSLQESCDSLKQKAKSTEIKVNSMTSNIVLYIQRGDKLNQMCHNLDQQIEKVVEQFEIDMKLIDQKFLMALENYSNENRVQLTTMIYGEITAEETALNQILAGQQDGKKGAYDLEILSRNLTETIDSSKQKEKFKAANDKNVELRQTITELQKTIKELEGSM